MFYNESSIYTHTNNNVTLLLTRAIIPLVCYQLLFLFQNGLVEIDKLDKFLGLDLDESLKREIIDMCGFEKMSADKKQAWEAHKEKMFSNGFMFFRKGNVKRNYIHVDIFTKYMQYSCLSNQNIRDANCSAL